MKRDYEGGIVYILGGHRLDNCHEISFCHLDLDKDVPGSIPRKQGDLGLFFLICMQVIKLMTYVLV